MQELVDSEDEETDEEFEQKKEEDGEFVKEIMQKIQKCHGNCGHFENMGKSVKGKVRFEKMPKPSCQKDKKSWGKQSRELEVNVVEGGVRKSRITIDSGAEESVWPIEQIGDHDLVETEASRNGIGFVAANGAKMKNFGALKVDFRNSGKPMSMNFHATNVKKPLAAVCRITECGNRVCFGPNPEDNYIMNIQTNEVIQMKKERGTYVLEIDMENSSVFTGRE